MDQSPAPALGQPAMYRLMDGYSPRVLFPPVTREAGADVAVRAPEPRRSTRESRPPLRYGFC
jgi:hypothetical protein